jgi:hypothetical protein
VFEFWLWCGGCQGVITTLVAALQRLLLTA